MKKGNLHILGNYELGYFIYEIGKPNPEYKVIETKTSFKSNIAFNVHNMKGEHIGAFSSIYYVMDNIKAYHNSKPSN